MNEIESETTKLSSDKPYIQFQNVSKKFGNFTAINDLTLDIFNNEFFSLLGPSGCERLRYLECWLVLKNQQMVEFF